MTSRVAELEAEIAVLKAEEAFLAVKKDFQAGTLKPVVYNAAKEKLRKVRQAHRELREQRTPGPGEVRPATVRAKAKT